MISESFHGPLSEAMQPPLSAQVHVPPMNSGNSLIQNLELQSHVRLKSLQE